MVKTRQWQDTQLHAMSDVRPWLAYQRTLRHLDVCLGRKPGFQEKFGEWLDECLNSDAICLHMWSVRNMLEQGQKHWQHEPEDEHLHAWQGEWLDEPLHYQWMSQSDIAALQEQHPFNLGHNVGRSTPTLVVGAQSFQLTAQQPIPDAAENTPVLPGLSLSDFLREWVVPGNSTQEQAGPLQTYALAASQPEALTAVQPYGQQHVAPEGNTSGAGSRGHSSPAPAASSSAQIFSAARSTPIAPAQVQRTRGMLL